jgi:hypothetical protein
MSVAIKEKPSRPTCALSLNVSVGEISTNAIRRDGVIDNSLVADGDLVRRKEGQIGKLLGDDPLEVLEVLEAFAGIGLDGGGFQKTIDFRILVTRTAKTMPSIAAQGVHCSNRELLRERRRCEVKMKPGERCSLTCMINGRAAAVPEAASRANAWVGRFWKFPFEALGWSKESWNGGREELHLPDQEPRS